MSSDVTSILLRAGSPEDAAAVAALATLVFLDTYAPEGVRPDLAREAFRTYSQTAFEARLAEPDRQFVIAAQAEGVVGFAELLCRDLDAPAGAVSGAELVRLYIQPRVQGQGVGRRLLAQAEALASGLSLGYLWLTAWEGNQRALAFYRAMAYEDVGGTTYSFEGNSYGNRVFAKRLELA